MIRWEYKSYLFERNDKVLEVLNSLGKQGWEATIFRDAPDGGLRVWFKRQLVEQTKEPV